MARLFDLARMQTATTGTGTLTLGAAVTGFVTFAQAGVANGDVVTYAIEDGTNREIGRGTYSSSGPTLTRDTVLRSSSVSSKISLSGSAQVFIAAAAEDIAPQTVTEQSTVRTTLYAAPYDAIASENLIINAAMEVTQEIGTATKTLNTGDNSVATYNLDQWFTYKLASNSYSVVQAQAGPTGFRRCLHYGAAQTQALGATHFHTIGTYIEQSRMARLGFGGANACPKVTIGFWVQSSVAGAFTLGIGNPGPTALWRHMFTINAANTWEFKTTTINGETSNTWISGTEVNNGMWLYVCVGAGSSMISATLDAWDTTTNTIWAGTGQAYFIPTASDYFRMTGFFIVPMGDQIASSRSPLFKRPFETELDLCMRYYETSYDIGTTPGAVTDLGAHEDFITTTSSFLFHTTANAQGGAIYYKKVKRAQPGIATYSTATGAVNKIRDVANNVDVNGTTDQIGHRSFQWLATQNAQGPTRRFKFHWTANSRM